MLYVVFKVTKRLKIEKSSDGEIHFIVKDHNTLEHPKQKRYNESEALRISKKEASKPLLLLREE